MMEIYTILTTAAASTKIVDEIKKSPAILLLFSKGRSIVIMVYRSNNLYAALGILFFLIGVFIVLGSLAFATSVDFKTAYIVIGLFIFVISFSYFNLSWREYKGVTD
jgi:hypothetical protein